MATPRDTPIPEGFVWDQPKPRIVQYKQRRYALRLEAIYWHQLEALAQRRGQRLGALVAGLAQNCKGPNLSSYIRGFCMVEAERDLARYRLGAGAFDLVALLRGCPAPALLLNEERMILETNQAFQEWLAEPGRTLRQVKFDAVLAPRVLRPMDETIDLMRKKVLQRTQIQVAHTGPGGTRTAVATLTALPVGSHFYCLVWLHAGAAGRVLT